MATGVRKGIAREVWHLIQEGRNSLKIKFLGRIFLGHQGKRRDIPDKNFTQVALVCCFRQGVAGMSRDLGRDVLDLDKLLGGVKRHLRGRHLSVLNLNFDFISDGGCTREEQIALSLKRHLFPHGGREPKAFWICFSRVHPPSEIKSNFKSKTLKRHLTLSEQSLCEKTLG